MDLLGIPVPYVPESLAIHLNILSDGKRDSLERAIETARPEVILAVKYVFSRLRPVGERAPGRANKAILYIGPPTTESDRLESLLRELIATPIGEPLQNDSPLQLSKGDLRAIIPESSVFMLRSSIPRARQDPSEIAPQLTVQFFPSIYDALRKTHHEEMSYSHECAELLRISGEWDNFTHEIQKRYVSQKALKEQLDSSSTESERETVRSEAIATNQELRAQYGELLENSLDLFRGSIHREKKKIEERLTTMLATFKKDAAERLNKNVISLQTIANIKQSILRVKDARIKSTFNHNDKNLLQTETEKASQILSYFHTCLKNRANAIHARSPLFSQSSLTEQELQREVETMHGKLNLPFQKLSLLRVRPFSRYRDALTSAQGGLREALSRGHQADSKSELARMALALRVFQGHLATERIRVLSISLAHNISVEILDAIKTLKRSCEHPLLFKEAVGIETSPVSDTIQKTLAALESDLERLKNSYNALQATEISKFDGAPQEEERKKLSEEFARTLERYDFDDLLNQIVSYR